MIYIADAEAILLTVKPNKKGKTEDNLILEFDAKFQCITKAEDLTPGLLGNDGQVWWQSNELQEPLFIGLDAFTSKTKVEMATLTFAGIEFKNVTLQKWKLIPRSKQMVEAVFTATISGATKPQRLALLEHLKRHRMLEVEGEIDLVAQAEKSEEDNEDLELH